MSGVRLYTLAVMFGQEPEDCGLFRPCRLNVKWGTCSGPLPCRKITVAATSEEDARRNLVNLVQALGGTVRRAWLLRSEPLPVVRVRIAGD